MLSTATSPPAAGVPPLHVRPGSPGRSARARPASPGRRRDRPRARRGGRPATGMGTASVPAACTRPAARATAVSHCSPSPPPATSSTSAPDIGCSRSITIGTPARAVERQWTEDTGSPLTNCRSASRSPEPRRPEPRPRRWGATSARRCAPAAASGRAVPTGSSPGGGRLGLAASRPHQPVVPVDERPAPGAGRGATVARPAGQAGRLLGRSSGTAIGTEHMARPGQLSTTAARRVPPWLVTST